MEVWVTWSIQMAHLRGWCWRWGCQTKFFAFPPHGFCMWLGLSWLSGWAQRSWISSMCVKAAYLLRPSLRDYTTALLLLSSHLGKSQERPRFRVGRSRLHCWMGGVAKNVFPSLFHSNYLLCAKYSGKCFVHCTLYKPQNRRAGETSLSSVCHLGNLEIRDFQL